MISPFKIFLEALLLVVVIVLVLRQGKSHHRTFALVFTAICFVLNMLFYYLAAWPLYLAFGESDKLSVSNGFCGFWNSLSEVRV
jgi:hypothetical protein